jgi:AcrR family transcriptional regulator
MQTDDLLSEANPLPDCTQLLPEPAELDAKTRLILTGERLFADVGIQGVSMREIAAKAGQGNHFAVQYHFGSREGLVQAIFDFRMQQMEAMRGEMIAALEANGRHLDAYSILEVILLPQLHLDGGHNRSYGNFLSQYLLQGDWDEFGHFGSEAPPQLGRALALLRERVNYLPAQVAQRRLVNVSLMFLNLLVRHSRMEAHEFPESFEHALDDTMEQIVTAMCLPLRRHD